MTNGTAAGRLLADEILDRGSAWGDMFDPNRFKPLASKSALASHTRHVLGQYAEDYLGSKPPFEGVDLGPGEAGVYETDTDPVAVYRDSDGEVHARSAVCPHMGCLVSWNDGEQSWDCSCHGSRFDVDGEVLDTPAVDGLADVRLASEPDS
ncbi:Rieske 2Fe-2S domain-containing protein [Haloarcula sediminis]|uniref:Rieske 2Fe-2S domain-containing protein n=1 Tax=Haloarcula sediminis TaxID=3111777 RepID=UPI002D78D2AD|nr:Rieske 2Fe-2S domain-containing protein [Haloarcula sp. CK38]